MNAIPNDVRQTAAKTVFDLETRIQSGEFSDPNGTGFSKVLVATFENAILAERQRDQWQVIETYPQDGSDVLVRVTYNLGEDEWETIQWVDSRISGAGWLVYPRLIEIPFPPTHWMPLPAAPKVEG